MSLCILIFLDTFVNLLFLAIFYDFMINYYGFITLKWEQIY